MLSTPSGEVEPSAPAHPIGFLPLRIVSQSTLTSTRGLHGKSLSGFSMLRRMG